MKSNITRILSIILALSLIICCFSACGGKDETEEPTYNIEMPTNPDKGSEDVFVNDGSNNSGSDLGGTSSGSNNGGSSYVPNNGGSSYVPNYSGNSGSSNSGSFPYSAISSLRIDTASGYL